MTLAHPPPVAPPLVPKTGPKAGSLRIATAFLSNLFKASTSPMAVVVLPSP